MSGLENVKLHKDTHSKVIVAYITPQTYILTAIAVRNVVGARYVHAAFALAIPILFPVVCGAPSLHHLTIFEIVLLLVDIYMYIINFTAHFSADLKLKPGSHLYALMMGS